MTGQEPIIDDRAGLVDFTQEQMRRRDQLAEHHPLGRTGVVFEDAEMSALVAIRGQLFIVLVQEILTQLHEGENGLIVGHSYPMIYAEKELAHLEGVGNKFGYLDGFQVGKSLVPKRLEKIPQ